MDIPNRIFEQVSKVFICVSGYDAFLIFLNSKSFIVVLSLVDASLRFCYISRKKE